MKKSIIKGVVFLLTFLVTLFVSSKLMNKGHNNMTMELAKASFPVVTMESGGIVYNRLLGYSDAVDVAFQRDTVTVLGENRNSAFHIDTYGREIDGISIEVRSADASRLIENSAVTDYRVSSEGITGQIALKDLIEKDTEYSLAIVLNVEEETIRYYTRVLWSDNLYLDEKLSFVTDFHERLYDKEAARELTRYLETNSQLQDNKSFHYVNIHSSFQQITWGEMQVTETVAPTIQLTNVTGQTASLLMDYAVSTGTGRNRADYQVQEYYRIRYTTDRMYLLDYERTMNQIPKAETMYANDKLLLGIADENVQMTESEDGNIVVFEQLGQLFSYNAVGNKLTTIFAFYDENNQDARTAVPQHGVKILDVDEGGNVWFAVYGYMSRGRHEGEVGIQINTYNSELNTVEETVYLPYAKTFAVLKKELEQLLYMNREQQLYLFLENKVYGIDLTERTANVLVEITQDDSMQVSDNAKIIVWQEGDDVYDCNRLLLKNLSNGVQESIEAGADEAVRPLGFMGEDMIYGVAKKTDILRYSSGDVLFPMYKVCICNSAGELLKEYQQNNIYTVALSVEENQITLERLERSETGSLEPVQDDHIMDNTEVSVGRNVIAPADIDIYERYVQIQTRGVIDGKTIKLLQPKEVVFEGGRQLQLASDSDVERYYVYSAYGVEGIYNAPAKAVLNAYEIPGIVVNEQGNCIWLRGNRVTRNQIMAIKEAGVTEEKSSLAVCLDTILNFEGMIKNSEYLLSQGKTACQILEESLEDAQILDLTGCNLDSVLYYVNQDIPVLALLENGEAVLVTGFNEYNVVIMEPSSGTLYKKGMNDATEWFAQNGNRFITYIR